MLLAKFCTELLLEVIDELLHDSIDGFVIQGLCLVLQDEIHSIRFLAFGQVLSSCRMKFTAYDFLPSGRFLPS